MSDTFHNLPASDAPSGLHRGAVGRLSLLGQSVASIGPSVGAAAFFPFAFAEAGKRDLALSPGGRSRPRGRVRPSRSRGARRR